jgi:hypothetical protein
MNPFRRKQKPALRMAPQPTPPPPPPTRALEEIQQEFNLKAHEYGIQQYTFAETVRVLSEQLKETKKRMDALDVEFKKAQEVKAKLDAMMKPNK